MAEMEATESLDKLDLPDDQKPMYNKVQVSDVVRREKEKAYERGKKEALETFQPQQPVETSNQASFQPQSMGGMQGMSEEQIRQLMAREVPQLLQQHAQTLDNNRLADSFVQKIQSAESKYPGLEARVAKLDFNSISKLIGVINNTENTAEVVKELLDNPMKLANLTLLSHTQPNLIPDEISKLSNSIKQNMTAQAQDVPVNEPLDHVSHSNIGKDNGSYRSVRDFTDKYRGKL